MSSALLLDEPLLCYQPALVRRLGLAEAAIVQQLHYWAQRATNIYDGEVWVYKTYGDWADEIGISAKAVRGALDKLRRAEVVVGIQSPLDARDKTLWWRVDYRVLNGESEGSPPAEEGSPAALRGSPTAAPGISHAGDRSAVQRLRTETTNRENAREKPVTYQGRAVSSEIAEVAKALLALFNAEAQRNLAAFKANGQQSEHLRQVVGALLDNPEATFEEWARGLRRAVAQPPGWVDGRALQLGDIFGGKASAHTLTPASAQLAAGGNGGGRPPSVAEERLRRIAARRDDNTIEGTAHDLG